MFGEERAVWRKKIVGERGVGEAWRLDDTCVGFRLAGYMDVPFAEKAVDLIETALREAPPSDSKMIVFCDYGELTGADVEGRRLIQDAVKRNKDRFEVLHYFVPSKIIALAVQVSGLWHGIPSRTWTSKARVELEFVRVCGAK